MCAVQKYTRSAHGPRTRLGFSVTYPHPGGIAVDAFEAGGWVTVECLVEAPVERSVDGQVEKPQRLQRMFHGVARAPFGLVSRSRTICKSARRVTPRMNTCRHGTQAGMYTGRHEHRHAWHTGTHAHSHLCAYGPQVATLRDRRAWGRTSRCVCTHSRMCEHPLTYAHKITCMQACVCASLCTRRHVYTKKKVRTRMRTGALLRTVHTDGSRGRNWAQIPSFYRY